MRLFEGTDGRMISGMSAFTIDDKARFVSVLSFTLGSGDVSKATRELRNAIDQRVPTQAGFIGSVVMLNAEERRLLVVSIWESEHAWSEAQYDQEIGRTLTDVIEAAGSYEIETYETATVVRAP
jgi:heme-degrading monooxygenase HmoA